ncbi:hypothetical protein BSQ39_08185 [Loigolactobacillus backii]|uniref:Gp15 family bacteriophage protein n=1 Tax=Loigolactobacillus backii TaxID=375175 RepID=UPI000C1C8680|nr:Gp15 family bacteriophage protein [Loigolactobacillus backii]PIO83544.1 hypothetical protein BSQ39_08185 [Loigolactobacillus backii]
MLLLSEQLSEITTDTGKGTYKADLAFDTVLEWYRMIEDDSLDEMEKIEAGWRIFIGDDSPKLATEQDWKTAIEFLSGLSEYISKDPYQEDDESRQTDIGGNPIRPTHWYSYDKDSDAIYASFLFDYNLDLIDLQGKLRWEKFRALFNNLSPKSPLMRIISIRQTDVSKLEGQSLSDMVEAQSYYALDKSVSQVNDAFGSMFDMLKAQAMEK